MPQLGAAKGAIKKEVMSGEIQHEVYQDNAGNYFIVEDGKYVQVELTEDSDEQIPDDVHEVEVDEVEPTEDRDAYTDTQPTAGQVAKSEESGEGSQESKEAEEPKNESVNLYRLGKPELIDTVLAMDEAVKALQGKLQMVEAELAATQDYTLKLETYTLKAERVVESEKADKDTARTEVAEAVAYAKSLHEKCEALEGQLNEQAEYVAKLEEAAFEKDTLAERASEVVPFVENLVIANPQLTPWMSELNKAKSVTEARELANKYNNMKGNVRLDRVMMEDVRMSTGKLVESDSYITRLKSRGMI